MPDMRGWQLITFERLFHTVYGESLYKRIFQIHEVEKRAEFLAEQIEKITGLKNMEEPFYRIQRWIIR